MVTCSCHSWLCQLLETTLTVLQRVPQQIVYEQHLQDQVLSEF